MRLTDRERERKKSAHSQNIFTLLDVRLTERARKFGTLLRESYQICGLPTRSDRLSLNVATQLKVVKEKKNCVYLGDFHSKIKIKTVYITNYKIDFQFNVKASTHYLPFYIHIFPVNSIKFHLTFAFTRTFPWQQHSSTPFSISCDNVDIIRGWFH